MYGIVFQHLSVAVVSVTDAGISSFGDKASPISGKFLQILLLGIFSSLFVGCFAVRVKSIPQTGHNLGHVSECGVGIGHLDGGLRVSEEEGVC